MPRFTTVVGSRGVETSSSLSFSSRPTSPLPAVAPTASSASGSPGANASLGVSDGAFGDCAFGPGFPSSPLWPDCCSIHAEIGRERGRESRFYILRGALGTGKLQGIILYSREDRDVFVLQPQNLWAARHIVFPYNVVMLLLIQHCCSVPQSAGKRAPSFCRPHASAHSYPSSTPGVRPIDPFADIGRQTADSRHSRHGTKHERMGKSGIRTKALTAIASFSGIHTHARTFRDSHDTTMHDDTNVTKKTERYDWREQRGHIQGIDTGDTGDTSLSEMDGYKPFSAVLNSGGMRYSILFKHTGRVPSTPNRLRYVDPLYTSAKSELMPHRSQCLHRGRLSKPHTGQRQGAPAPSTRLPRKTTCDHPPE